MAPVIPPQEEGGFEDALPPIAMGEDEGRKEKGGLKREEYERLKTKADVGNYLKGQYGDQGYKAELAAILHMDPQLLLTYKYKTEIFTPTIQAKYAKDLSHHGGNPILIPL
jgi:hypothetical protein